MRKAVRCLLAALLICTPASLAQAAMIGSGEPLAAAPRPQLTRQLEALGLDPALARERVAAMSDAEVRALAGRIEELPAGGDVAGALLLVIVIAAVWWAWRGGFR